MCGNLCCLSDIRLLFLTRAIRLFSYGTVGVMLALYVRAVGYNNMQLGVLLSLTQLGDAGISFLIVVYADRAGRKRMLLVGSFLKVLAGLVFACMTSASTLQFFVLVLAGVVGVLSSTGSEVGPFMALEQSVLAELISPSKRTDAFALYNLIGYLSSGIGSLESGGLVDLLQNKAKLTQLDGFRVVFLQYAACALFLVGLFACLSGHVEAESSYTVACRRTQVDRVETQAANATASIHDSEIVQHQLEAHLLETDEASELVNHKMRSHSNSKIGGWLGLSLKSRDTVLRLGSLFALDSFAGSLINGSLLAYYFAHAYSVSTTYLGGLLLTANIMAGASSLCAGWIAAKIGMINTMVFTHLPSNVLTILIPVMPNLQAATLMVFLRFGISQMDVAPRQSYVAGIVDKRERTATIGITNIVKSLGSSVGPLITGWLVSQNLFAVAFFMCGGLKIVYDVILLYNFSQIKPDTEAVEEEN